MLNNLMQVYGIPYSLRGFSYCVLSTLIPHFSTCDSNIEFISADYSSQ